MGWRDLQGRVKWMRLRGFVVQIISPKRIDSYLLPRDIPFVEGKYYLTIAKPGTPTNRIKRFIYWMKAGRPDLYDTIALDSCPYKKKQWIDIEVKPFVLKTSLFVEGKGDVVS